jgi:hypothetical protein
MVMKKDVDGRDKPGHDERSGGFVGCYVGITKEHCFGDDSELPLPLWEGWGEGFRSIVRP